MKTTGLFVFAALAILLSAGSAKAWNCPSGEIRQQAPAGTPTTAPNYDVVEGIAFICVPSTPPSTPASSNSSNSTSNSASNSSSASNSASNSASSAVNKTKVTATGGNATSSATGGSVGDISNAQHQSQSQSLSNVGNSTSAASDNGNGNGDNSNNSSYTTNIPRAAATAYAPLVAPTTPCFKGYSGGGQGTMFGFSFGGGKIDQNCAALESSRLAPSLVARCKVYITVKYVKAAGVTMADCLAQPPVREDHEREPIAMDVPAPPPIITVNVPAPVVTVIPPPAAPPTPNIVAASHAVKTHHHVVCPCVNNDNLNQQVKKNP